MSKVRGKAEQRALKAYPKETRDISGFVIDIGHPQYMRDLYVEGYHQAEKDLRDISWIKEISGVKEMKRAEEEALKAYPPRSIAANYDTISRRDAFEYGYLKAEKDLELSWEDMRELYIIFAEVDTEIELCKADNIESETIGYYQEVLKRFIDFKERKEK